MSEPQIDTKILATMQKYGLSPVDDQIFLCGENNLVIEKQIEPNTHLKIRENAKYYGRTKDVKTNSNIKAIIEERRNSHRLN